MDKQIPADANQHCPGIGSQKAGKQSSCAGCPNQQACSTNKLVINPAIQTIKNKLMQVKHKILVLSGKGGVGKSTVATQLAVLLSQKYQVGLLDVDICGPSVPTMLGLVGQQVHQSSQGWSPVYCNDLAVMSIGFLVGNQNDAVIWRGPRKNGLIQQFLQQVTWGQLDFLIIDTPPGTSDEHLSLVQFLQCSQNDGAIIVTTPQEVALADVRKQLNFCLKTNIPIIGVVQNMSGFVCPNCKCQANLFNASSGGADKMCEQFKCPLICKIPLDPKVQSLIDEGKPIFDEQVKIESPVIQKYLQIQECNNIFRQFQIKDLNYKNDIYCFYFWLQSLECHLRRIFPHQILIDIGEALKLIESKTNNKIGSYVINTKQDEKDQRQKISISQLLKRIQFNITNNNDVMYLQNYFQLIDKNKDGFITYQDIVQNNKHQGRNCIEQKLFIQITEKITVEGGKLSKNNFIQIAKKYI